jgi:hypothetical protein
MFACYSRTIHTLPSDSLCFVFELLLPSKCPCVCHRRTFASKGHLASKGLSAEGPFPLKGHCLQRAFAIEGPLAWNDFCHRRDLVFAIEGPLPSKSPAFAFEGPLASKCLCHRIAFAFGGLCHRRKGLCHQSALAFAIERRLPSRGLCHRNAFTFKGPLIICRRSAFCHIEGPLPSKGFLF